MNRRLIIFDEDYLKFLFILYNTKENLVFDFLNRTR